MGAHGPQAEGQSLCPVPVLLAACGLGNSKRSCFRGARVSLSLREPLPMWARGLVGGWQQPATFPYGRVQTRAPQRASRPSSNNRTRLFLDKHLFKYIAILFFYLILIYFSTCVSIYLFVDLLCSTRD